MTVIAAKLGAARALIAVLVAAARPYRQEAIGLTARAFAVALFIAKVPTMTTLDGL